MKGVTFLNVGIENVLMKAHLKSINKYCQVHKLIAHVIGLCRELKHFFHVQILLTKVYKSISRSLFVTNFFCPSHKDKQLPRYIST